MLTIWRAGLVALVCTSLFPSVSIAQTIEESGHRTAAYLAISGGENHEPDQHFHSATSTGHVAFSDGITGSVALGFDLGDHFRTELELAVQQANLDHIHVPGFRLDVGGTSDIFTGMAKIAYDFDCGGVRPYLAAGLGIGQFAIHLANTLRGSDSDLAFAGKLEGGVSIPITNRVDLFANTQALFLTDVMMNPGGGDATELSHPILYSGSTGFRLHF